MVQGDPALTFFQKLVRGKFGAWTISETCACEGRYLWLNIAFYFLILILTSVLFSLSPLCPVANFLRGLRVLRG